MKYVFTAMPRMTFESIIALPWGGDEIFTRAPAKPAVDSAAAGVLPIRHFMICMHAHMLFRHEAIRDCCGKIKQVYIAY